MILDHLVVAGATLNEARAHVEDALGVAMQPGGQHAVFHTHNMLLGLEDGLYLEAIAADPSRPAPDRPRWFDLDRFAGPARLSNWVVAVPDLPAALAQAPEGCGAPVDLQRGDLRWQMAVSGDGTTPYDNLWPPMIGWPGDVVHPATLLVPSGVRLRRLTLSHPDALNFKRRLAPFLTDDRIAIEPGEAGMHAAFDTPHGSRSL
ncbi:MAG: VOC family protein [Pseudomonadota bacterium]